MYKKKRWAMALMVLLVAGVILTGCQGRGSGGAASSQKKVTIGYLPITHALPVFEEKELLEAAGGDVQIELQKFSSWTDLMDALNAGKSCVKDPTLRGFPHTNFTEEDPGGWNGTGRAWPLPSRSASP